MGKLILKNTICHFSWFNEKDVFKSFIIYIFLFFQNGFKSWKMKMTFISLVLSPLQPMY